MPEDPDPPEGQSAKSNPPDPQQPDALSDKEQEAGDFIARNVLDKDSVFFEG